MYPFSPKVPSPPGCRITLSRVPCAGPCWSSILNTAEYTSIPNSLTIPFPHPPHRQPQRGLSNRAVRIPRAPSGCAILSTPLSFSLLSYKMGINSCTKPEGLLWQWNWTRTFNVRLVQARPVAGARSGRVCNTTSTRACHPQLTVNPHSLLTQHTTASF